MKKQKTQKKYNILKLGYKFASGFFAVAALFIFMLVLFIVTLCKVSNSNDDVVGFKPGMKDSVLIVNIEDSAEGFNISSNQKEDYVQRGGSITYVVDVKNTSNKPLDYTISPRFINYQGKFNAPIWIKLIAPGEEYIIGSPKKYEKINDIEDFDYSGTLLASEVVQYTFKFKLDLDFIPQDYLDTKIDVLFDVETEENNKLSVFDNFFETDLFKKLIVIIFLVLIIIALLLLFIYAYRKLNPRVIAKEEEYIIPEPVKEEPVEVVKEEPKAEVVKPIVIKPKQPMSKRRMKLAEKPKERKTKVEVKETNFNKNKNRVKLKADIKSVEIEEKESTEEIID